MSNTNARHDDALGALAPLGVHEPDQARDARVRASCQAVLQKRGQPAPRRVSPTRRRRLEPAVVGTLCAAYLAEVLSRAIRLYPF